LSRVCSALIEHSPVAIVTLDSEHHVQTCNPAFEQLFRYSQSELVSGNLEELIATKENVPEAVSIWQRVIRGEKVYACTKRRRKDGSVLDVELPRSSPQRKEMLLLWARLGRHQACHTVINRKLAVDLS
jgi:PAS domain S-box-containing protein